MKPYSSAPHGALHCPSPAFLSDFACRHTPFTLSSPSSQSSPLSQDIPDPHPALSLCRQYSLCLEVSLSEQPSYPPPLSPVTEVHPPQVWTPVSSLCPALCCSILCPHARLLSRSPGAVHRTCVHLPLPCCGRSRSELASPSSPPPHAQPLTPGSLSSPPHGHCTHPAPLPLPTPQLHSTIELNLLLRNYHIA